MASYAIGDVQGCFTQFEQLLAKINFNSGKDTLFLVGDLVNRGTQSLDVLRWIIKHDNCVQSVLGNHDLHLLAVSEGLGKHKPGDTLLDILNAPDCQLLLDWLRSRALMIREGSQVIVHAGLLPEWSVDIASQLADEINQLLSGVKYRKFLTKMYGNQPTIWNEKLSDNERWRIVINVMTRMRMLTFAGELNFSYKGTLADAPKNLQPWFRAKNRQNITSEIICGHWSALGFYAGENIIAIDTGCIWGGELTAIRLDADDRCTFTVPSILR